MHSYEARTAGTEFRAASSPAVAGRNVQTCFEDGLGSFAPLVPSVGDDGDTVSLARLQTRQRKPALAASELLLNSLRNKQQLQFISAQISYNAA